MLSIQSLSLNLTAILAVTIATSASFVLADARASEVVLHYFKGESDGSMPRSALIADSAGNLYGTTNEGGGAGCQFGKGCGTVFELKEDGKERVLYGFQGGSDGAFPDTGLTATPGGNFYGTTGEGGESDAGTVFQLTRKGKEKEKVLYAFTGGTDGSVPAGDLIEDSNGNLYGTTGSGGDLLACGGNGCGVVFAIDSSGHESVLYAFTGGADGLGPSGGVIMDGSGNLYGETALGGVNCGNAQSGCGVVFKLSPGGVETVLHTFQGGSDGLIPLGGLIQDNDGNLYGTTQGGGAGCASGCGTVFKVAPNGTETVLYAFKGGLDGNAPLAGLAVDPSGNLYGTTYDGGGSACKGVGCGVVFEVTPSGTESVLCAFKAKEGRKPVAALLMSTDGVLYGTASAGGKHNDGVVFSVHE